MELLQGKIAADQILGSIKKRISGTGANPGLAAILVGNDPASHIYIRLQEKAASEVGIRFFKFLLPQNTGQAELLGLISELNGRIDVHGIIVQLPLPEGFNTEEVISSIDPQKDVDGFHPRNVRNFLCGKGPIQPVFPRAILRILESSSSELAGKNAVILANSEEFGQMMKKTLECEKIPARYVLSENIPQQTDLIKSADIVVSALGKPGSLKGNMFKEGVIIVDGGIGKVGEKITGDVDRQTFEKKESLVSPVPGGVGPLTIACLLENVTVAFEAQQKEK